jgi:hypothetical protein
MKRFVLITLVALIGCKKREKTASPDNPLTPASVAVTPETFGGTYLNVRVAGAPERWGVKVTCEVNDVRYVSVTHRVNGPAYPFISAPFPTAPSRCELGFFPASLSDVAVSVPMCWSAAGGTVAGGCGFPPPTVAEGPPQATLHELWVFDQNKRVQVGLDLTMGTPANVVTALTECAGRTTTTAAFTMGVSPGERTRTGFDPFPREKFPGETFMNMEGCTFSLSVDQTPLATLCVRGGKVTPCGSTAEAGLTASFASIAAGPDKGKHFLVVNGDAAQPIGPFTATVTCGAESEQVHVRPDGRHISATPFFTRPFADLPVGCTLQLGPLGTHCLSGGVLSEASCPK